MIKFITGAKHDFASELANMVEKNYIVQHFDTTIGHNGVVIYSAIMIHKGLLK